MQVIDLIELMASESPIKAPARAAAAAGNWRLVWSQQAPNASPLQKFGSKQAGNGSAAIAIASPAVFLKDSVPNGSRCHQADTFQLIDGETGALTNLVKLLGGAVKIQAFAECSPASDTRTTVDIRDAGR